MHDWDTPTNGERNLDRRGDERRWVTNSGGAVPEHPAVEKLLQHGRGHRRRWSSAGNVTGDELDQLQTEELLWKLVDAGLVRVHQRLDRRGEWESYQWTLTDQGEARVDRGDDDTVHVAVDDYLDGGEDRDRAGHPALLEIRRWLDSNDVSASPQLVRIVITLGRQLRRGRKPTVRSVSVAAFGDSKKLNLETHRDDLEQFLGCAVEEVFRIRGRAVYAWGDFHIEIDGRRIFGDWSIPWLALTADTLEELSGLHTDAGRVITIENLAAFESFVRHERPDDAVVVFTSGFPGRLEQKFLQILVAGGIERIHHWGDLDVGGLRILRHLHELFPSMVEPFRMDPVLLEQLPTRPLTSNDRTALQNWIADSDAPFQPLADALLETGAKVEQEAWYAASPTTLGKPEER